MNRATPKTEALKEFMRTRRIIRPRDLDQLRIPRNYLGRFVRKGLLTRLQRGLYASPDRNLSEYQSLIEVSHKVPKGVICLFSALRFHELTTQSPHEVWIALDVKAWQPKISYPPIRVVRLSGQALHFGVREHLLDGEVVRVFTPAKTVADCFKFRNKIGLDVALEALRDTYRLRKASTDELWAAAKVCRVTKIMQPYMESLQ
jgi:predicted transcriptional regulator of viral defense system